MARPIEIEIKADVDDALRDLKKVEGELGDVEKATESTGAGFGSMSANLAATTVAVGAAIAAIRVLVNGIVQFGEELERQNGIMNRFTGNIEDATERTGGLVSQLDLMLASNKLSQAGLNATAEEFGALSVAAQEAASRLGTDFGTEMQRITQALATGGVDALREYGIVIETSGDKAVDSARALEAFRIKMEGTSSSADTLGGQITRLTVAMDNMETGFLRGFDASNNLARAFEDLFKSAGNAEEGVSGVRAEFSFATRVGIDLSAMIQVMIERLQALGNISAAAISGNVTETARLVSELANAGSFADRFAQLSREGVDALREQNDERERRSNITEWEAELARVAGSTGTNIGDGGSAGDSSTGGGGASRFASGGASGASEDEQTKAAAEAVMAKAIAESNALLEEQMALSEKLKDQEIDRARDVADAEDALHEQRVAQVEKLKKIEEDKLAAQQKAAQQQMAQTTELVSTGIAAGDMLLEAFGATQGQKELWQGISDVAMAITSFAQEKYAQGALFLVSSALHFKNAAEMGIGGGGGAAPAGAQARPTSAQPTGGGGGGTTTNNININSPMSERDIGRTQRRVEQERARRFDSRV